MVQKLQNKKRSIIKQLVGTVSVLIVLGVPFNSNAQFNNQALYNRTADSLQTQYIYLHLNSFNFVRNYEYYNAFQDGYTLFGTILEPQMHYKADDYLTFSVGAFLRKDFGNDGLYDSKALFSIKYAKKNTTLQFGSLEGNVQRGFIEPLYDLERRITDPVEYGTQLKTKNAYFNLDAWIAWDKMIYKNSRDQEQISGGLKADIRALERNNHLLQFPVQFIAKHKGGQIDVNQTDPLSTVLNAALGIKYVKTFKDQMVFNTFFMEHYWVGHKDQSPLQGQTFKEGSAVWLNLGISSKYGTFITSYWNGNNFQSIKGTPIFQSISSDIDYPDYTEKERSLLLFRYAYQKPLLPKLFLDIRLEPIIDLKSPLSHKLDFSGSFFLTYKENFKILKIK